MDIKQIAVAVAFGIGGGLVGAWGGITFGLISSPAPKVVTFNIERFINAERAVASGILQKKGESAENATIVLAKVSKMVRSTIQEEAGPNTLVLVKQGVVSKNIPDITTKVLVKLGLPTKEPSPSPMSYATNIAPTDISQGMVMQAQQNEIKNAWAKTGQNETATANLKNQGALP